MVAALAQPKTRATPSRPPCSTAVKAVKAVKAALLAAPPRAVRKASAALLGRGGRAIPDAGSRRLRPLRLQLLPVLLLLEHRLQLRQQEHRAKGEQADQGHGALEDGEDVEFLSLLQVGKRTRGCQAQGVLQLGPPSMLEVRQVGRHLHRSVFGFRRLHPHGVEDEAGVHDLQQVRAGQDVVDEEVPIGGRQRAVQTAIQDDLERADSLPRQQVLLELLGDADATADLPQALVLRPGQARGKEEPEQQPLHGGGGGHGHCGRLRKA
mmetsp:Transcript_64428/g.168660  ORF Transcript_64428/g.168660 Transcript_64428/m.168660 type:complete len:266 (-) Transcript_64428:42-839(-)